MTHVVEPALSGDEDWESYAHKELYDSVHDENDPGSVGEISAMWSKFSSELDEAARTITSAVTAAEPGWTGAAAEAARGGMRTLAEWVTETAGTVKTIADQVGQQANIMGMARASMPEPLDFNYGKKTKDFSSDSLSSVATSAEDAKAANEEARARHEQAVEVMRSMETQSQTIDNATPQFTYPHNPVTGETEEPQSLNAVAGTPSPGDDDRRLNAVPVREMPASRVEPVTEMPASRVEPVTSRSEQSGNGINSKSVTEQSGDDAYNGGSYGNTNADKYSTDNDSSYSPSSEQDWNSYDDYSTNSGSYDNDDDTSTSSYSPPSTKDNANTYGNSYNDANAWSRNGGNDTQRNGNGYNPSNFLDNDGVVGAGPQGQNGKTGPGAPGGGKGAPGGFGGFGGGGRGGGGAFPGMQGNLGPAGEFGPGGGRGNGVSSGVISGGPGRGLPGGGYGFGPMGAHDGTGAPYGGAPAAGAHGQNDDKERKARWVQGEDFFAAPGGDLPPSVIGEAPQQPKVKRRSKEDE